MATFTKSRPAKLEQFLREQQEPFILEVYLSERGRVKKNLISEANNSSKKRKIFPDCSKVLRAVYNKLLPRNKSSDYKHGKPRTTQEVAEPDRFSSTSGSTVYNSCPESDAEEPSSPADHSRFLKFHAQRENEADTDEKFQWRGLNDSKEHSPTSVLGQPPCSRGFPIHNETEEFIFSDSASESLLQSTTGKSSFAGSREVQELMWIDPPSQYLISKRVLHQTKQLMFDCVRELVGSHRKKERRSNSKEVLGAEELRQLICEKIKGWGKQSNIKQLLDSDFVNSLQEWSDFETGKRNIGLEIGNAILEDIIREIVMDTNDLHARM